MDYDKWKQRLAKRQQQLAAAITSEQRARQHNEYVSNIKVCRADRNTYNFTDLMFVSGMYATEAECRSFKSGVSDVAGWSKSLGYAVRDVTWLHRWRYYALKTPESMLLKHAGFSLAHMLALGWTKQAILFGNEQLPRVASGYFSYFKHDGSLGRVGKLIFRLFAEWQGVPLALEYDAADIPEYRAVLDCWRDVTTERLTPALLRCCDWHLEQTAQGNDEISYEFEDSYAFAYPIEILAVLRLRELIGLENPKLDHPLMNSPLGVLPPPQPWYTDELLDNFEAILRKDLPQMFAGFPKRDDYI
jgi:hypothetical protein